MEVYTVVVRYEARCGGPGGGGGRSDGGGEGVVDGSY